mmetsp:Transcript_20164/g.25996  ORF Transcript_20164/g.25996 Transcript_20164/m.25996 type:complete len:127 (+) Transcript_20164:211-591(+)|eukprot:CAMPEP_0198144134 /NCGR_PEP_ID=MMETSP1443-20131203/13411_1 /TAXON_ID=186043 /ORGANISM="Entomoneis sp., Strain CCMP2396" /LENGTH=126 /DNA_ID=CAMNT_0043807481 /DNA_START=139 /DNA_END=519 /DNA_ORIENTATION=+
MGSFQSTPSQPPMVTYDSKSDNGNSSAKLREPDPKEAGLSGVDLVNYKCRKKEKAYKKCVSNHYKKNLLTSFNEADPEDECGDLFELYRRCYLKGMQIEVWEKNGKTPPVEGSMLAQFSQEVPEKK